MTDITRVNQGLSSTYTFRLRAIAEKVEAFVFPYGLSHRKGDAAQKAKLERWLNGSEAQVNEIEEQLISLTTKPRPAALSQDATATLILASIAPLAMAKGALIAPVDTLFALTVQHGPAENREFWNGFSEPKLSGWLQLPEMIELARARGILLFYFEPDRRHRIVNVNRLTTHAEIRRFILGNSLRGRRCRFCQIVETPIFDGLVAQSQDERHSSLSRDAITKTVHLKAGHGYVHAACLPTWNKWVSIAAQYPTDESAVEADRVANRTSVEVPPAPEPEPVPEPPPAVRVDPYSNRFRGDPSPPAPSRRGRRGT